MQSLVLDTLVEYIKARDITKFNDLESEIIEAFGPTNEGFANYMKFMKLVETRLSKQDIQWLLTEAITE